MRTRTRFTAALLALGLVAAACGSDREDEEGATATTEAATETTVAEGDGGDGETTETTAAPEAEGETFGDLAWPCGPGDATGNTASDVGITEDTILIGTGDDRGYAASPGLNAEIGEAVEALAAKCNELGGINGRMIEVNNYDAAILAVNTAMTQACEDQIFMLVGQGFALDASQEEIRLGCDLATVPAYSVSAAFAHGPGMIQPVPNPADKYHTGVAAMVADLFPDEVTNAGTLYGNFSATIETKDKVLIAYPNEGWEFGPSLEYNIGGEDDWTPFVLQLKDAGTQAVYFSGSCLPNYQAFMQAAAVNELELITALEANYYDENCANANADGAMDGSYIKMVFIPFEEADANKATQDYIDIVTGTGGGISLLGMQATSAFLLWAQAAKDCGADLTRQCILDTIATYEEWTAGGLHAPSNPASNDPVECGVLVELVGTEYVRVHPEEPGTFDCESGGIVDTPTQWVELALLDENRVSQQFVSG
jgi:ABC-type branched-subunit amino acid transport system substrate-binding protein